MTLTYSASLGEAKFYVDGVLTCTKPYTQNFTPDLIHSFSIGRSLSGPDEYSDGLIDELKIYNRVLTNVEITALPLTLISFNGENKNGTTFLHWQTNNEINVSHFEIERSNDGNIFEKIGIVPISARSNYSFNDSPIGEGNFFYRLKIVDIDGQYKYSNIIKIKSNNTNTFNFSPNPTKGQLAITGVHSNGRIKIFSIDGKLVKQQIITINMKIDISNLEKGTYIIQYINKNETQSKLLIKQ